MKNNLLFILTILMFWGCHKAGQNYNYSYISAGIKSQEFKPGSYWIYQNDSTLKTDSTFIYYVHQGFEEEDEPHSYTSSVEYYEMWYYNDNRTNGDPSFKEKIESDFVMRTINSNVYEPSWQAIYTLDPSYPSSSVVYFDSLQSGNHMFYKVDKITAHFINNNDYWDSTDYYTAKSIGVIKKVSHDSIDKGTWNLVRWKIIKN
jgi:hypothetical protein